MITADQLLCHAIGDYVLQSDWMATEKTKKSIAALAHAATYGLPFLVFRPSLVAYAVIIGTHFIVDRWRLARFVAWLKNWIAPVMSHAPLTLQGYDYGRSTLRWENCRATGYPSATPPFLAVWLLIITDNVLHVIINGVAPRWL